MTNLIPVLWILSGILGSLLLRHVWCLDFNKRFICMCPAVILLLLIATTAGPGILFLSIIMYLQRGELCHCWFFRPICKRDK